nr:EOG090X0JX7 [Lepidurus arcticus]
MSIMHINREYVTTECTPHNTENCLERLKCLKRNFNSLYSSFPSQLSSAKVRLFGTTTSLPWKADTGIAKDVLLFRYENLRFFRMLGFFGVSQFIFWVYLTDFALTYIQDKPEDKADPQSSTPDPNPTLSWTRLGGVNIYTAGLATLFASIGSLILFCSAFYSLRAIRYLVLRKGGQAVTIVTYGPFGKSRYIDVPLADISAKQSRQAAKVHLPLKIRNNTGHFIIDMRGEFLNGPLFDATAGLKRFT